MRRASLSATLLCLLVPSLAAAQPEDSGQGFSSATLQALDKVTARVSMLEARPLLPTSFGKLDILVKTCWSAPGDQRPEQAALLEIHERQPGSASSALIFSGWMFASSPALSALEHPVYDITLISCE